MAKPSRDKVDALLSAANQLLKAGDYSEAERLYQDLIALGEQHPRDFDLLTAAYSGLADSVEGRGGDAKALRLITKRFEELKADT